MDEKQIEKMRFGRGALLHSVPRESLSDQVPLDVDKVILLMAFLPLCSNSWLGVCSFPSFTTEYRNNTSPNKEKVVSWFLKFA